MDKLFIEINGRRIAVDADPAALDFWEAQHLRNFRKKNEAHIQFVESSPFRDKDNKVQIKRITRISASPPNGVMATEASRRYRRMLGV